MSRWLVAARVARREVRRHWVRSALVVLIIALPVLAAQAAALYWGTAEQRLGPVLRLAVWDPEGAGADERTGFDPRLGHPPAVEGAEEVATGFVVRDWTPSDGHGTGPDDLQQVSVVGFVPGRSEVPRHEGREPRTRHEVVVTGDLAAEADLAVGDEMEVVAAGVELTVVGIADLDDIDTSTAWAGPPADDGDDWVPEALARFRDSGSDLVSAEMFDLYWLTPEARAARGDGEVWMDDGTVSSGMPMIREGPNVGVVEVVVVGASVAIAVGFIATTASAAFAIGARRQLRQLGTLAATGAAPADLLRAVVLQGTTLGVVGAVVATGLLYLGRLLVVRRWLDDTGWTVPYQPGWALAAAILGVVAGTAAAVVPALTASRIPVLSALAGARPVRRRPLRSPKVGLVAIAVGLAGLSWASGSDDTTGGGAEVAVAAVGVLAVMAGAAAVSPGLVALVGRLSARARGTVRLAGRGLERDGMRSAAVVASTAVALAIPVVVLVYGARDLGLGPGPTVQVRADVDRIEQARARTTRVGVRGPADERAPVVDEVVDLLGPDALVVQEIEMSVGNRAGMAYTVPPDGLRAATGDDAVADALEAGAVVRVARSRNQAYATLPSAEGVVDRTRADVVEVDPETIAPLTLALLDDTAVGITAPLPADEPGPDPGVDVGYELGTVVAVDRVVPDAVVERVVALNDTGPGVSRASLAELAPGPGSVEAVETYLFDRWSEPDPPPWTLIVLAASLLVAVLVIGTASALAAADGREDNRVVAAVGAPPTVVRRRRALEATFTAAAAVVLGGGLGTVATLVTLHHPFVGEVASPPLRLPLLDLMGLGVGAVALVGGVTWVVLAVADRVRGRADLILGT